MTVNNISMIYAEGVSVDKDPELYFFPEELTRSRQCRDKGEYIVVKADVHFNMSELEGMFIPVFRKKTPFRQALNAKYKPNPQTLKTVLKLLLDKKLNLSVCLQGESGTGKTEMALYLSHMLNWPLTIKQIHSDLRPEDLEGERKLDNGSTSFDLSDLAKGYRDGHLILLDEIDKIHPDTSAKLHMILEKKPWSVSAEGGLTIKPHEYTRFLGTANTNMSGSDARFLSSQKQDEAFIKRWLIVKFKPTTELEMLHVLESHFPDIKTSVLTTFVKIAIAITKPERGVIMDKRNIVSWVQTCSLLADMPVSDAFDISFGNALNEDDYIEAQEHIKLEHETFFSTPFEELKSKKS